MKNTTEYEANAFASHLLLDTDEMLEYAHRGYGAVEVAQLKGGDINLVLIKLAELNKLGYDLRMPTEPDGCFFKKIHP